MQNLGKKLLQHRNKHSYSQEEVADKLGISQSNYSRIESDKFPISAELLPKLAQLYGISVTELVLPEATEYMNQSTYKDNAFSSYLVYQESQKQSDQVIEAQKETISSKDILIKSLQETIADLRKYIQTLENHEKDI